MCLSTSSRLRLFNDPPHAVLRLSLQCLSCPCPFIVLRVFDGPSCRAASVTKAPPSSPPSKHPGHNPAHAHRRQPSASARAGWSGSKCGPRVPVRYACLSAPLSAARVGRLGCVEGEGEGRREREREIKNDESDSRAGLSCGKRIELHSTIHRQLSLQEGDAYSNFLLVQRTELAVFQGNKVHIDTIEAAPARVADHAVVADSVTAPFG